MYQSTIDKYTLKGEQQRPTQSVKVSLLLIVGSLAVYTFTLITREPNRTLWAAVALCFQIACWVASLIILAIRNSNGHIRLSDPGVLVMLWGALYLICPSIIWFQGGIIPYSVVITEETGILVFWLHGLFFLGFMAGYQVLRHNQLKSFAAKVDVKRLPSGWLLFLLPLLPLIVITAMRLAGGGSILPDKTYGDTWAEAHSQRQAIRTSGGFGYLLYQVWSKIWFYPILLQGVGAGLVIIRVITTKRGRIRALSTIFIGVFSILMLSSGSRSYVLIILIIAFIFADAVIGPLRWRSLAVAVLLGMLTFESYGYYRLYRDLGFGQAVKQAYDTYKDPDNEEISFFGEFSSMLGKESLAVEIFQEKEGLMYLVRSVAFVLPSQILPAKTESWVSTDSVLSEEILGRSADDGFGVAGTMIGDGYKFAGILGVPVLAAILGLMLSLIQYWLTKELSLGAQSPLLLKAALVAGVYGWTFNIIREDLQSVNVTILYYLVIPWLVLSTLLKGRHVWMKSVPVEHS